MNKRRIALLIVLGLVGLVLLVEKTTRYTYDANIFTREHISVHYRWKASSPIMATDDPVNVGAMRKWLGLRRYQWSIDIPSFAAFNHGGFIHRETVVSVAPVSGETYECVNGFWTITCDGDFHYKIDPSKTLFMQGGAFVLNPSENWLTATRHATLTVYKYF